VVSTDTDEPVTLAMYIGRGAVKVVVRNPDGYPWPLVATLISPQGNEIKQSSWSFAYGHERDTYLYSHLPSGCGYHVRLTGKCGQHSEFLKQWYKADVNKDFSLCVKENAITTIVIETECVPYD
jgi:hypothetical protein